MGAPYSEVFSSLWAAIDGGALTGAERPLQELAFLGALSDSIVFFARRMHRTEEGATRMVEEQVGRIWEELGGKRVKVDLGRAGKAVARCLVGLGKVDEMLWEKAWGTFERAVEAGGALGVPLLKAFVEAFEDGSRAGGDVKAWILRVARGVAGVLRDALEKKEDVEVKEALARMTDVITVFGGEVFANDDAAVVSDPSVSYHTYLLTLLSCIQCLDEVVLSAIPQAFPTSVPLLLAYLSQRGDRVRGNKAWSTALRAVAECGDPMREARTLLGAIVPEWVVPEGGEMDHLVERAMQSALGGGSVAEGAFVKDVLRAPGALSLPSFCVCRVVMHVCRPLSVERRFRRPRGGHCFGVCAAVRRCTA